MVATRDFHTNSALKAGEICSELRFEINSQHEPRVSQEMGLFSCSSVFSVSIEQIAVLHKRFRQLSHNDEKLR